MSSFDHRSDESRPDFAGPLDHLVARRDLLAGGLFAGAALILAGCQTSQSTAAAGDMPGPVWPDQENPQLSPLPRPTGTSAPASPGTSTVTGLPQNVIPRATWTRQSVIRSLANPMNGVNRITIHHDAIPSQSHHQPDRNAPQRQSLAAVFAAPAGEGVLALQVGGLRVGLCAGAGQ